MNLILSDVEETIMIVDTDSAPNGQSIVNVRTTDSGRSISRRSPHHRLQNEKWICCLLEEMVLFS